MREIDESEILQAGHGAALSWGVGDKICGLLGEEVTVVRYVQSSVREPKSEAPEALFDSDGTIPPSHKAASDAKRARPEAPFDSVGTIPLSAGAEVIKAGLTYFGVLLETTDQLLVYRSDNEVWSTPGPIVRWRTYPRAKYYENHLHIVAQDAVHIVSFMHDYWQEQKEKIAGITYRREATGQQHIL